MSEIQAIDQKHITPREGIIVPLPDGNGNLPATGKVLTLNSYWYQRKFDGDVTFEDVDQPKLYGDVTIEDMAHATDIVPLSALGSPRTRNK